MQRRMFSPAIVESDAFLDMPISCQNLYFHLGMYADDDGFVNPKKIMRMIGASDDDLKVLLSKRFLIVFKNGVVVVKHWRMNNLIRKDWHRPTQYIEEMKLLSIKENGAYTESKRLVTDSLPTRSRSIVLCSVVKDSVVKNSIVNKYSQQDLRLANLLFELIKENNPTHKQPNIESWAEEIRKMREIDKRTEQQIEFIMKWAQNDNFWRGNILSTKKLREKFDQLVMQCKNKIDSNKIQIS
jgi:hypothetical protein